MTLKAKLIDMASFNKPVRALKQSAADIAEEALRRQDWNLGSMSDLQNLTDAEREELAKSIRRGY